jgi:ABC-type Na+ efflux pump permease subunit
MGKTWIVARSEYIRAVRAKAFIIGVILMPVFMGAGLIMAAINAAVVDVEDRRFAIVDRSGGLYELLEEKLDFRNANNAWDQEDPPSQILPRFLLEPTEAGADGATVVSALADRVRSGELIGYLVIGADVIQGEPKTVDDEGGEAHTVADLEIAWHTETPTYNEIPSWLIRKINEWIRATRFETTGLDPQLVKYVSESFSVARKGLHGVSSTGEVTEAEESHDEIKIFIPIALTMMIYMLMLMNAPALMNNVLEEKMQKIAEVLVSSVSPFQLVLGKVISAVLVAMTLMVIYVGAALVFVHLTESVPQAVRDALSVEVLAWFTFFLFMGLVMLGSMCAALGAACSELRDAQSLMMPVILSIIVPLMFLMVVVKNPNGTISQIVSYFPTATPLLMFLRVAIPPGVAWWELVLSVVLMLTFSTFCVFAGAKIFRIGILSQGQAPSFRKILSWITSR